MTITAAHVEAACVFAVLAAIFLLDAVILPRAPADAFAIAEDPHAGFTGSLTDETQTANGWQYRATLCRNLTVWSETNRTTAERLTVTGELKDNTLFVDNTQPSKTTTN